MEEHLPLIQKYNLILIASSYDLLAIFMHINISFLFVIGIKVPFALKSVFQLPLH